MAERITITAVDDVGSFRVQSIEPRVTVLQTTDFGPQGPAGVAGPVGPMRFPVWIPEQPGPSEIIFRVISSEAFNFTPNTCFGVSLNVATSNTTFTVSRSNTDIGTITFQAGSNTANVSFSNTYVAANTPFQLTSQFLVDATLAGISITLTAEPED